MRRTLREGGRIRVKLIPIVDDEYPRLRRWRQLNLASAAVEVQYSTTTHTDTETDIGNFDIDDSYGDGRVWQGVVDAQSDIPDATAGVWYVNDSDPKFYYRLTDSHALASVAADQSIAVFVAGGNWLGRRTLASVQSYFESNTYVSGTRYYFFNTDDEDVHRFTRTTTTTWTTLEETHTDTTTGIDTDLFYSGWVGSADTWHGVVASSSDIPDATPGMWYVSGSQQFARRQNTPGANVQYQNASGIESFTGADWLGHHTLASVQEHFETNEYDSSETYFFYNTTDDEVQTFSRTTTDEEHDGIAASEVTFDTTELLDSGIFYISLASNSVDEDKRDTFRIEVVLTD